MQVTTHVTCATDTGAVRVTLDACTDAILRENARASGLLGVPAPGGGGSPAPVPA